MRLDEGFLRAPRDAGYLRFRSKGS